MRWLLLSIPVVASLNVTGCTETRYPERVAGPAPPGRADSDLDRLQGTWRIESSTWNGVEDPEIGKSVVVHFEGDKFIVVDRDGNRQQETIKLRPDQNPKAIDCTSQGGDQPAPGIYALEVDVFKWCSAGGANKLRPTSFASQPGSRQSLLVLRRTKDLATR
jgi:uncharacterized protein (TIGR03067 family)